MTFAGYITEEEKATAGYELDFALIEAANADEFSHVVANVFGLDCKKIKSAIVKQPQISAAVLGALTENVHTMFGYDDE